MVLRHDDGRAQRHGTRDLPIIGPIRSVSRRGSRQPWNRPRWIRSRAAKATVLGLAPQALPLDDVLVRRSPRRGSIGNSHPHAGCSILVGSCTCVRTGVPSRGGHDPPSSGGYSRPVCVRLTQSTGPFLPIREAPTTGQPATAVRFTYSTHTGTMRSIRAFRAEALAGSNAAYGSLESICRISGLARAVSIDIGPSIFPWKSSVRRIP